MNIANTLTISRFPLLFVIAFLLYVSFPGSRSLAFVLYLFSGLSDWADGYIARRYRMVSNFGKFMDALSDKILVLGLFIVLLTLQILPEYSLFLILLILGREFFVTGIRLVAASQNIIIAAEKSGKIKTIIQMFSVGALICSEALLFDFYWFPGALILANLLHIFGILLFIIGAICAIESGIRYTRKYRFIFDANEKQNH